MISETDEEPMDLSIPGRPSQNLDIPARRRCLFVSASHPVDLSYRETIGTTSFDRNSSFGVPLPGVNALTASVRPLAANQRRAVSPGTFCSNSCFGAHPQGVSALIASFRPLAANPGSYSSNSSFGAPPQNVSALTASVRPLVANQRRAVCPGTESEQIEKDPNADNVTGPGGLASSSSFDVDVAIFGPLKQSWRKIVEQRPPNDPLTTRNFAANLEAAMDESIKEQARPLDTTLSYHAAGGVESPTFLEGVNMADISVNRTRNSVTPGIAKPANQYKNKQFK